MPIEATCEECGNEVKVREELGGKKIRCKECGGVIEVPEAAPVSRRAAAGPVRGRPGPGDRRSAPEESPRRRPEAEKPKRRDAEAPRRKGRSGGGFNPILLVPVGMVVVLGLALGLLLWVRSKANARAAVTTKEAVEKADPAQWRTSLPAFIANLKGEQAPTQGATTVRWLLNGGNIDTEPKPTNTIEWEMQFYARDKITDFAGVLPPGRARLKFEIPPMPEPYGFDFFCDEGQVERYLKNARSRVKVKGRIAQIYNLALDSEGGIIRRYPIRRLHPDDKEVEAQTDEPLAERIQVKFVLEISDMQPVE